MCPIIADGLQVAIFSHWVLDVIVHTPDMAIITGGGSKVGLGLWESAIGTYLLEAVMIIGGLWLYLRATGTTTRIGKYGVIGFVAFLLLFNIYNLTALAPDSESDVEMAAIPVLAGYLIMAGIAFWLDRKRAPRIASL